MPFKSLNIGRSLSKLSLNGNSPHQDEWMAVCSYCPPQLEMLVPAFQAAGMHGIYLHNRHLSHSTPQRPIEDNTETTNRKMSGFFRVFLTVRKTVFSATAAF